MRWIIVRFVIKAHCNRHILRWPQIAFPYFSLNCLKWAGKTRYKIKPRNQENIVLSTLSGTGRYKATHPFCFSSLVSSTRKSTLKSVDFFYFRLVFGVKQPEKLQAHRNSNHIVTIRMNWYALKMYFQGRLAFHPAVDVLPVCPVPDRRCRDAVFLCALN